MMHWTRGGAAACLLFAGCRTAQPTSAGERNLPDVSLLTSPLRSDSPFALRGVHIIDVDGTLARNRTVVVERGRVTAVVDEASGALPPAVRRIESARGRFVLAGLADMHVHAFDRDELVLFLANGITTIRHFHGQLRLLALRDSIRRQLVEGPDILMSGPILDGSPPTRQTNRIILTREEARAEVRRQHEAGYDLIKLYDNVDTIAYAAVMEEARSLGIPVTGHVPTPGGLAGVLAAGGQTGIEHAEEFFPFFRTGRDTAGLGQMALVLARRAAWFTPTIDVMSSAVEQARLGRAHLDRDEMKYVNPATIATWGWMTATSERHANRERSEPEFERRTSFARQLARSLHDAGVKLLVGTDAPMPNLIPGFSIHEELAHLEAAGISRVNVLRAATINAAEAAGRGHELGAVRTGYLADLVLLDGDPTANLANLRRPAAVVVRGTLLSRAYLDRRLDSLARMYSQR